MKSLCFNFYTNSSPSAQRLVVTTHFGKAKVHGEPFPSCIR